MSEVSVRTEDPELTQPTAQHIAGVSLLEIAPGGVFAATVGDDGTLADRIHRAKSVSRRAHPATAAWQAEAIDRTAAKRGIALTGAAHLWSQAPGLAGGFT